MAGLCFYFEDYDVDVWSGHDLDAWNYAAKTAGDITKIIVVNKTDQLIRSPDSSLELFEVVQELPKLPNSIKCVGPNEKGPNAISLWDFSHDVDWYIFGPAAGWGGQVDGLNIPQAGRGALHSVHACTVIMTHRYHVKRK